MKSELALEKHWRNGRGPHWGLLLRGASWPPNSKGPDESMLRLTRSGQSDWSHAAEWLQAQLKSSADRPR